MSNDEPFVQIRERTGHFNFADPSEEQTLVKVTIPEYDFKHKFTFREQLGVEELPWGEALWVITDTPVRNIGDREPQERLTEIRKEHYERIEREWAKRRANQIEQINEDLQAEKEALEDEYGINQ